LVEDSTPDLYFVCLTSLNTIANHFGRNSPQFLAALELIHDAIATTMQTLQQRYSDKFSAQVVLLNKENIKNDKKIES